MIVNQILADQTKEVVLTGLTISRACAIQALPAENVGRVSQRIVVQVFTDASNFPSWFCEKTFRS